MEAATLWLLLGLFFGLLFSLVIAWIWLANRPPPPPKVIILRSPDRQIDLPPKSNSINVPTRGEPPAFRQVGVLTTSERAGKSDEPLILPLLGRPTYAGSRKWEYYAGSDKVHPMRIPVEVNKRACDDAVGCDEIEDGDTVFVPTYQRNFTAVIYKSDRPRYIPN